MQQPFVCGDAARGMNDHGGFGLGLSPAPPSRLMAERWSCWTGLHAG